ncbi:MAG: hypothetical protein QOE27_2421 [Solirubrobacteraceae bacterium]|nr:hypothetical protein [Solirubrobacteraceae bacterium]MEA2300598.1 hypothetical protein [Solirubrobacteraceae bacterium]
MPEQLRRSTPLVSARMHSPLLSPRKALTLGVTALILEMLLILPVFDQIAGTNPTAHFTQHGGIFLGGVLMGIALRDMFVASRR